MDQRFLPPEVRGDPELARRGQLTVVLSFFLSVACLSSAGVSLFGYALPVIAAVDVVAALLALSVPFVLRATGSLALAANLTLAVTVATMALAAGCVEGITSPAMTWLIVVPIFASLIGGRGMAVRWAVVCTLAVVAMSLAMPWLPAHELPVAVRRQTAAWNYVLMFAMVAVFAQLYERLHARSSTALAAARAELERAREQAALTERMAALGRLAAGVAHEINNPSTFVVGNVRLARDTVAQVLAGASPSSELREVQDALSDALTGATRITETVRDLKTLGRAGDEGNAPVDAADVLDTSLRIVSHQLRQQCMVEKTLHPVSEVLANESRLGQVFVNLLTNAGDAMPPGRPTRENRVRVVTRMSEGRVCIEISDNGAGIEPDALSRIFDPFFTTKPVGQGTGLGLSICRRLVDDLGGQLEVESKLGVGTTFRVRLPALPVARPRTPAPRDAPQV
ncbi:MAG: HAMP domain-containing histidine kinase [Archangiaceae bacterium]|nr:HAMP domain-containing histidine kinase [Archangiaceae bacterium]